MRDKGGDEKIGSRETIAFQRRDSVRNYNALQTGSKRYGARRDRRMSGDIRGARATHMHEHAWTPQNARTRDTHSRSVAGRPSVPKHAVPRVSWKHRNANPSSSLSAGIRVSSEAIRVTLGLFATVYPSFARFFFRWVE